jgi:competence protein ComEA
MTLRFCALGLAAFSCAAIAQENLPEGKGRDEFVNMCNTCHGLESVTGMREGKKGWERIVDEMLGRGAVGTDEQVNLVIDYLAAHFGKPVNVNKAASKELQEAFAISAQEADAIVKYRQDNGDFKTLADLLKVPGVNAQKIEPLRANIVF